MVRVLVSADSTGALQLDLYKVVETHRVPATGHLDRDERHGAASD